MKFLGSIFIFLLLVLGSCRKDSFITSPQARVLLSADTLKFDTLFTSSGSTYRTFTIKNDNNQKLRISSLQLMGGGSSAYKMNVDGIAGSRFQDIDIAANDSIYVFVQVNIDPTTGNLPFIVRDSIMVSYNGRDRKLLLEAWGQNAHFFRNKVISSDETWNNDLPYVILGSLHVPSSKTLTINKGCRIFVHADAPIVIDGTLRVNGEKEPSNRVYFQGDRLDEPYVNYPASWPGIFFRSSSRDNELRYAVIKNAYQGIAAEEPSPNTNPKIVLNECILDNHFDAGIIALNSSIRARNCLISNCGKNLVLIKGGDHQFTHCTVVTYGNRFIDHKSPVLQLSNFISINNNPVSANLNAVFRNCIFWGANGIVDDEVQVVKNGNTVFNVNFDHNLWKVQNTPANITSNQIINNQPPLFDSVNTFRNHYNFRLKSGSPAINKGVAAGVNTDLDGLARPVGLPDLGCYEQQ